jgi:diguanylate cyclase (GGDEF)-like protein
VAVRAKSYRSSKSIRNRIQNIGPDRAVAFLARLATEFTAVLNLPDLLDQVMRVLHEETGFESCTVALVEGRDQEVLRIRAASGRREEYLGLAIPKGKGLHWAVVQAGTPLLVPDMAADPRVFKLVGGVRSGLYAPLLVHGRPIGVLSAHRTQPDAFTEGDLNLLTVVARYLAGAIEVARLHEQLKELAATDPLTGLSNRRSFYERLTAEIARSQRNNRGLSIALLDLNGLKAINDVCGHGVGDQVLIQVAESLERTVRASDLAARYGGDEFVLLFPETPSAQAELLLNQLRSIEVALPDPPSEHIHISFCWGIASWPQDGQSPEGLLRAADVRLYAMKHVAS